MTSLVHAVQDLEDLFLAALTIGSPGSSPSQQRARITSEAFIQSANLYAREGRVRAATWELF